jgi:4-amino-4-deoxychorismate lyase
MAKIELPYNRERIRRILIQTVSASKCRKGSLRYWLSAGPGDFQLSPSACYQPALYAVVIQDQTPFDSKGIRVITSSIPIKPPQFATMKSVNYLPNVLSKMEAEENGAYAAIWLDSDGFVAEGPNMNVAFVTKQKEFIMPSFDYILSGCTAKRVLTLAAELVREGKLGEIKVRNVTVEEGKEADEMMLIGSGVLVRPVVQWDEQVIGNGKNFPDMFYHCVPLEVVVCPKSLSWFNDLTICLCFMLCYDIFELIKGYRKNIIKHSGAHLCMFEVAFICALHCYNHSGPLRARLRFDLKIRLLKSK